MLNTARVPNLRRKTSSPSQPTSQEREWRRGTRRERKGRTRNSAGRNTLEGKPTKKRRWAPYSETRKHNARLEKKKKKTPHITTPATVTSPNVLSCATGTPPLAKPNRSVDRRSHPPQRVRTTAPPNANTHDQPRTRTKKTRTHEVGRGGYRQKRVKSRRGKRRRHTRHKRNRDAKLCADGKGGERWRRRRQHEYEQKDTTLLHLCSFASLSFSFSLYVCVCVCVPL